MTDEAKQAADVAAGGVTISAVMVCIRIYETETVKKVIGKK